MNRHSRTEEFDRALAAGPMSTASRWHEVSSDPNAAAALVHRARELREAWRPSVSDRLQFLEERCRGRAVLDVGCVAHDVARMSSPGWLHRRLAAVADRCVGVDVDARGIEAMRAEGFEAVEHDLADGLGPLAERAPFDVIVAGELIEHVESVGMIFETARASLADDGHLILTTPNPYAPERVHAAWRGLIWENADHIFYAFPSGMAELAARHGLSLAEARDVVAPHLSLIGHLRRVRRWFRGTGWRLIGISTFGSLRAVPVRRWWDVRLSRSIGLRRRFRGETFIYVFTRRGEDAG